MSKTRARRVAPPEIAGIVSGDSSQKGSLIKAVFSSPKNPASPARVRVRRISGERRFQLERVEGAKAFHDNLDADGFRAETERLLAEYGRAEFTLERGILRVLANRKGELTVLEESTSPHQATSASTAAATMTAAATTAAAAEIATMPTAPAHDREKRYLLPAGTPVPFLVDLGVMREDGSVVKSMYDKFRQINRFLEFIDDVLPTLTKAAGSYPPSGHENHPDHVIQPGRPIRVVDFGCGKSYLTFAVHHYLVAVKGLKAEITGLDLKDDVIERCSALAERLGAADLHFQRGDIASYSADEPPDLVISLHACDTATDAALAQAIAWKAPVILAVPCCQHELNAALSRMDASNSPLLTDLGSALKHGIVRERVAALLTDASRAESLERAGYRAQILEFIDMSHTPKNLLIRAVLPDRSIIANQMVRKDRMVLPDRSIPNIEDPPRATSVEAYAGTELYLSRALKEGRS